MADTALAYSTLAANSNLADPAGTSIVATNTNTISAAKPERTLIRVTNTDSADHIVTVKAGDTNPPAFARGLGDLSVTVAATSGVQWIGPFDSSRFLNTNGSLVISTVSGHAGKITAFLVPKSA